MTLIKLSNKAVLIKYETRLCFCRFLTSNVLKHMWVWSIGVSLRVTSDWLISATQVFKIIMTSCQGKKNFSVLLSVQNSYLSSGSSVLGMSELRSTLLFESNLSPFLLHWIVSLVVTQQQGGHTRAPSHRTRPSWWTGWSEGFGSIQHPTADQFTLKLPSSAGQRVRTQ